MLCTSCWRKMLYIVSMKSKKNLGAHPVVLNLRKIMNDKCITQSVMAEYAGVEPSQFSKIMNGSVQISLWQISNIATNLNMDIIDIFTYPDKFEKKSDAIDNNEIKAVLTIELKSDMKKKILRMIFDKDDIELLDK